MLAEKVPILCRSNAQASKRREAADFASHLYRHCGGPSARKQLFTIAQSRPASGCSQLLMAWVIPRAHPASKSSRAMENYRIRVGDYRVIYSIFDDLLLVEVVKVGQRGNFYDE